MPRRPGRESGRAARPLAAAPAPHGATTSFASVARARRVVAEYQPGYDGLPGGVQGLRALRIDYDYDYDYD